MKLFDTYKIHLPKKLLSPYRTVQKYRMMRKSFGSTFSMTKRPNEEKEYYNKLIEKMIELGHIDRRDNNGGVCFKKGNNC